MRTTSMTAEVLKNIGFRDIGKWEKADKRGLSYRLEGINAAANEVALDTRNALYAFVVGDVVAYIGKTARSIRRRFVGYCNPGSTQQTNRRCHQKIQELLAHGTSVRIYVCTFPSEFRYGDFQIDLAAGLEEALISRFNPPWNGGEDRHRITEEAEREAAEAKVVGYSKPANFRPEASAENRPITFSIPLHATYYNQGFINPGVDASRSLGNDGDPVIVFLGSEADQVDSFINRSANTNNSVRIVGNNRRIAEWFQNNFDRDEVVEAEVLDRHRILLKKPNSRPSRG